MSILDRIFGFCASLRLAVIVIVSIGVISAIGTIYEARYDAEVAQKLVYHSVYMYVIMGLLIINLVAVMIDRWPWRPHHAGFVLAHVGIIVLLFGAWLTQRYGVDGSMVFDIGQERDSVTVRERDLMVYASFDGSAMQGLFQSEVDFLKNPPSEKDPFIVQLGAEQMRFVEYHQYAFRESEIVASSDAKDGPAVRFQLENPNINLTEWLRRDRARPSSEIDLGPAKVVLSSGDVAASGRNEVILISAPGAGSVTYKIFGKDRGLRKTGIVETGWMGLKFRLLRHLPHAREVVKFQPSETSSPLASSAARFTFRGQDYWIGLNSVLRIYLEDRVYLVSYGQRQLRLDFGLKLEKFRVGMYQGTERAASYESEVRLPEGREVLISMNEPLHYRGYTFYQASFEKDETGKPTTSILSVNFDPGRWVKYLGSLLIVLGSIVLFYFKRVQWLKAGKTL